MVSGTLTPVCHLPRIVPAPRIIATGAPDFWRGVRHSTDPSQPYLRFCVDQNELASATVRHISGCAALAGLAQMTLPGAWCNLRQRMPITVLTARDLDLLTALDRCPLTADQTVKLSRTFSLPFPGDRLLRRRMTKLAQSGLVRRATYTAPSPAAQARGIGMPESVLDLDRSPAV